MVRGPNIMSGYLKADGGIEPPAGGWHDTGDVVSLTDDGWIKILGRVKRFAKVGGEMVSLMAAEDLAAAVWPDCRHSVVALADPKKGERLILVTDRRDAETGPLIAYAREIGAPELAVPRKIIKVQEIPVLGTGKTGQMLVFQIVLNAINAGLNIWFVAGLNLGPRENSPVLVVHFSENLAFRRHLSPDPEVKGLPIPHRRSAAGQFLALRSFRQIHADEQRTALLGYEPVFQGGGIAGQF